MMKRGIRKNLNGWLRNKTAGCIKTKSIENLIGYRRKLATPLDSAP